MNAFRMTPDGSLDRRYMRACAIWRLLKNGHIDKAKARELAAQPIRGEYKISGWLNNTIEIWLNGPLKHRREA